MRESTFYQMEVTVIGSVWKIGSNYNSWTVKTEIEYLTEKDFILMLLLGGYGR